LISKCVYVIKTKQYMLNSVNKCDLVESPVPAQQLNETELSWQI